VIRFVSFRFVSFGRAKRRRRRRRASHRRRSFVFSNDKIFRKPRDADDDARAMRDTRRATRIAGARAGG
jgi:hypothetical protein